MRLTSTAIAALVILSATAEAAELVRVRGVIENATDTSVTVKTSDGKDTADHA